MIGLALGEAIGSLAPGKLAAESEYAEKALTDLPPQLEPGWRTLATLAVAKSCIDSGRYDPGQAAATVSALTRAEEPAHQPELSSVLSSLPAAVMGNLWALHDLAPLAEAAAGRVAGNDAIRDAARLLAQVFAAALRGQLPLDDLDDGTDLPAHVRQLAKRPLSSFARADHPLDAARLAVWAAAQTEPPLRTLASIASQHCGDPALCATVGLLLGARWGSGAVRRALTARSAEESRLIRMARQILARSRMQPFADPPVPFDGAYWLLPAELMAGHHPSLDPERSVMLARSGVRAFMDFTEPGELPPYSLPTDDTYYCRLPVPDTEPPTPRQAAKAVRQLIGWTERGMIGYFHCFGGIGRTGTVAALFLQDYLDVSAEEALSVLRALRRAYGLLTPSPESPRQHDLVRSWIWIKEAAEKIED